MSYPLIRNYDAEASKEAWEGMHRHMEKLQEEQRAARDPNHTPATFAASAMEDSASDPIDAQELESMVGHAVGPELYAHPMSFRIMGEARARLRSLYPASADESFSSRQEGAEVRAWLAETIKRAVEVWRNDPMSRVFDDGLGKLRDIKAAAAARAANAEPTTPQDQVTKLFPVLKDRLGLKEREIEEIRDRLQWAQNEGRPGTLAIEDGRVLIDGEAIYR